jgi:hypothetical protein
MNSVVTYKRELRFAREKRLKKNVESLDLRWIESAYVMVELNVLTTALCYAMSTVSGLSKLLLKSYICRHLG